MNFLAFTLHASTLILGVWLLTLIIRKVYADREHAKDMGRLEIVERFGLAVFPPSNTTGQWSVHRRHNGIGNIVWLSNGDSAREALDRASVHLAALDPVVGEGVANG